MSRQDLSIPRYPETIFVVELETHILITWFPIKECIFPLYVFDDRDAAVKAAEDISIATTKLVANAVDYPLDDCFIYNPLRLKEMQENIRLLIKNEKEKSRLA